MIFIDIETATQTQHVDELPERLRELWIKHCRKVDPDADPEEQFRKEAPLQAEFGRIVCVTCGCFSEERLRLKSFFGPDEGEILEGLRSVLDTDKPLCGHNIKQFDFPYMGKRFMAHKKPLPSALRVRGKKPWEIRIVDTLECWQFGSHRLPKSLDLVAAVLGLPSPKTQMDGSKVGEAFWKGEHEKIRDYCELDVLTTANVYRCFEDLEPLGFEQMERV